MIIIFKGIQSRPKPFYPAADIYVRMTGAAERSRRSRAGLSNLFLWRNSVGCNRIGRNKKKRWGMLAIRGSFCLRFLFFFDEPSFNFQLPTLRGVRMLWATPEERNPPKPTPHLPASCSFCRASLGVQFSLRFTHIWLLWAWSNESTKRRSETGFQLKAVAVSFSVVMVVVRWTVARAVYLKKRTNVFEILIAILTVLRIRTLTLTPKTAKTTVSCWKTSDKLH